MPERVSLPGLGLRVASRFPSTPVAPRRAEAQPIWLTHRTDVDYRALFAACLQQPLVPTQWLNPEERQQHDLHHARAVACAQADWSASGGRPPGTFADWLVHAVFAAGGIEALLSFAMPSVQETWRCSWQVRGSAQRRPQQNLHPQAVQAAWDAMQRVCAGPSRCEDDRTALVVRALAACHHVADLEGLARCATLLTAKGTLPLHLFAEPQPAGPSAEPRALAADTFALLAPYRALPSVVLQPVAPAPAPAPTPARQVRRRFFGVHTVARATPR